VKSKKTNLSEEPAYRLDFFKYTTSSLVDFPLYPLAHLTTPYYTYADTET